MFKRIVYLIILILSIINIYLLFNIEFIPSNYIYLISILLVGLLSIGIYFSKRKNKILKLIGIILLVIIFMINMSSSFLLVKADSFFNSITNVSYEVNNYRVIVRDKDKYRELEDISNKKIGIINSDKNFKELVSLVKEKVSCDLKEYNNVVYLINDLFSNEIDGVIISDSYFSIIEEAINDFDSRVRVIDNIEIKEEEKVLEKEKEEGLKNSFNVYISGIDTYGDINVVSRSDVNMVASINIRDNKVLLTNIPRDMYVPLVGTTGLKDKLTHAGVYGINTSIGTLENFLDIDIDYYVRINFNTLISIVDYLGGIDVYSDYNFKAGRRYYNVGMNYNLSGKEALEFSRNRYAFRDGDRQRGRNQQKVIEAIVKKITESRDIQTYFNLINTLERSFQTNMDKSTIGNFINMQIENNYNWNIEFTDVNGFDSSNYTYSYPWQVLYVMEVDINSLDSVKSKIKEVLGIKKEIDIIGFFEF